MDHFCTSSQRGYRRHLGNCNKKKENTAGSGRPCRNHTVPQSLRREKTAKISRSNRQPSRTAPSVSSEPQGGAIRGLSRRGKRSLRVCRPRPALTVPLPGNAERRQTATDGDRRRSAALGPARPRSAPLGTAATGTRCRYYGNRARRRYVRSQVAGRSRSGETTRWRLRRPASSASLKWPRWAAVAVVAAVWVLRGCVRARWGVWLERVAALGPALLWVLERPGGAAPSEWSGAQV